MKNLITLILVSLLAACGMGKKGDKISHRPPAPESTIYVLSDFHKITSEGHIPVTRMIEHTKENRLRIFEAHGTLVDPTNRHTFNATWRGSGTLMGNSLINYNPNHTITLKFVIEEPHYGLLYYSLVLQLFNGEMVGTETIGHKSDKSIMSVTFTKDDD